MRLIDADVLMAKIDAWDESAIKGTNPNCKNGNEYEAAMDICIMVEESPTIDAVPVVRCADCKHWYGPDDGYDHSCDVDALLRPGRWFCPAGQRREDGEV